MFPLSKIKYFFSLLFLGAVFLFPLKSFSYDNNSQKYMLENGMAVVISEIPSSPMVSVYALVKTGSATEGEFLGSGITHFMEHMLFKGTKKRKVGEIAAKIQSVGGTINASTGKDYTIYTITVPFESFDVALDIQADILQNSTFDPEEIEKERKVILNEMRLHEDNPSRRLADIASRNRYLVHPYKYPVIGYREIFSSLKREDFFKYYEEQYVPNNIVLSIAGNVKANEIMPKIKEVFSEYKRKSYSPRNLPEEPQMISARKYEEEYPTDVARISIAYPSVSLLHRDLFALDVLARILGSGRSSRLYRELYEKQGVVHSIVAYNYTPVDQGEFVVKCVLDQEKIEEVLAGVEGVMGDVKETYVEKSELEKVKNQVVSEFILEAQTSSEVAYRGATDEAFTGDHQFSEKYVEGIKNVSQEDVSRVAKQYLQSNRAVVTILKPQSSKDEVVTVPEKRERSAAVEKEVLSNGITLLLKNDKTFPVVAIRMVGNGGLRAESEKDNGISQLMASMLLKGTKNRTAQMIAKDAEFPGIRFSSFSGKNSFGVSQEFVSDRISEALDLFQDVIRNSTFPQDEIDKVKDLMRVSIRQRADDISRTTAHEMKKRLFESHFLGLEPEGSLESLEKISREDLIELYKNLLVPQNVVFSVFGDFDEEVIVKFFEDEFGGIKGEKVEFKDNVASELQGRIEERVEMEKDQAMVMIGFRGAGLNHEDREAIDLMTTVLGSPFSGRFFSTIREKMGNAYSIGGNYIPSMDSGIIYFYALTSSDQAEKVKKMMLEGIEELSTNFVSEDELKDSQELLKGQFRQSIESNASLGFTSALEELYGLGYDNYLNYYADIDDVNKADIRKVARKYLDTNKAVIIMTLPKDSK